jgi:hypothetical protein
VSITCNLLYYIDASSFELQQRGKEKVKLLECLHIVVSRHRATRHSCPGLAELAVPSSAACSLCFTASSYSGESNDLYNSLLPIISDLTVWEEGITNYHPIF